VGADGKVRLVHITDASQPELLVVDPATGTVAKVALPNDSVTVSPLDSLDPAVGTDGSLYLSLSEGPGESGRVARVSPDGTPAWRSAVYAQVALGVTLGPGDRPYVLTWPVTVPETGVLLALDPATGATRWSRTLPGQPISGPAVRSDGRVEVITGSADGTGVVWVLSPEDGSTVWSASTGVAAGIWLGLAADDSVVFISSSVEGATTTTVSALDAGGAVRWHRTLDGDLYDSGALDASGLLLLASSDSLALDVETGETRWSLASPSPSCAWPLTVSTGGVAYGVQCDGTFFAASD
jgi:outer membrane protein assembly factor BamB